MSIIKTLFNGSTQSIWHTVNPTTSTINFPFCFFLYLTLTHLKKLARSLKWNLQSMSAGLGVWGIWKWDVNPSFFFFIGCRQYPGKAIINLETYSKKVFFISTFFHSLRILQREWISRLLMCLYHIFSTYHFNQDRGDFRFKDCRAAKIKVYIFGF